jgi:hypothetical protein
MKPKQSEDEKLFRINSYSYRFVGGVPGVPARLHRLGRVSASRSIVYVTNAAGYQSEQSFIWPSLDLNVAG